MSKDLVVPALGESITEAVIGKWLKNVGEKVGADEPVADLETDKVTVQLPAPAAGVLVEQKHAQGATVRVGDVIGRIDEAGVATAASSPASKSPVPATAGGSGAAAGGAGGAAVTAAAGGAAAAAAPARAASAPPAAASAPSVAENSQSAPPPGTASGATGRNEPRRASTDPSVVALAQPAGASGPTASTPLPTAGATESYAPRSTNGPNAHPLSPAQRKAMREHGDLPAAMRPQGGAPAPAAPAQPGSDQPPVAGPDEEVVALSPLRKRIAERLVQAQHTAAILTTFNEVDMSTVMAARARVQDEFVAKHGVKLGFMSFFVKAVVASLKEWPGLNAEVRGGHVLYKKHYDIGVAVGSGKGLVVPVLRGADKLGFAEIEKGIAALATKAKDNKLTLEDLSGGTFTISNGGIYGSMMSTPLLNMPQTGILGMHNIVKRAVVDQKTEQVTVKPMMYLALSYDHRLVDGREAVSFLVAVKERLETPDRMLYEV